MLLIEDTMNSHHQRIIQIVRQFPENSMKLLLENPLNVRDLLLIAAAEMVQWIDFNGLRLDRTSFVQRDYRHVESDVVLTAVPSSGSIFLEWLGALTGDANPQRITVQGDTVTTAVFITRLDAAARIEDHLLTGSGSGLDVNRDGKIDVADIIYVLKPE